MKLGLKQCEDIKQSSVALNNIAVCVPASSSIRWRSCCAAERRGDSADCTECHRAAAVPCQHIPYFANTQRESQWQADQFQFHLASGGSVCVYIQLDLPRKNGMT